MQVKKQQLEPDMEQQTGSKLGKEYVKVVYCHPAYLTYMQSMSSEMLGLMKNNLESRLPGEISITSDMQMTAHLLKKAKEGLMLKLKLQYFVHQMERTDSLEKTLMLGKIEGRRRRGPQRMRWLDSTTNLTDMKQSPGVGDGQGSLVCCSSWGLNELDMTE